MHPLVVARVTVRPLMLLELDMYIFPGLNNYRLCAYRAYQSCLFPVASTSTVVGLVGSMLETENFMTGITVKRQKVNLVATWMRAMRSRSKQVLGRQP